MNNASFLPEDYLKSRTNRRTNMICLTLFVIVTSGVVGAFLVTDQQRAEVIRQQRMVDQDFQQAAERIDQVNELRRRKDQMVRKARVTATLLERVPRSNILAELVNNLPSSVSLLSMELETKVDKARRARARTAIEAARQKAARGAKQRGRRGSGAAPTQVESPPVKVVPTKVLITLTGTAATDVDVAEYMTALGRSPLFDMVNLLFSEQVEIDANQVRKFKVDLLLNQDLPMLQFEPKMVRRGLDGPGGFDGEPIGADLVPISATVDGGPQGD